MHYDYLCLFHSLGNNGLTGSAGIAIAESLKVNQTLTELQ